MRKYCYWALLLLFFCDPATLWAQTGRITGNIQDSSGHPIASASVSLLLSKDSSLYRITMSDEAGRFLFDGIREDSFVVTITRVGSKKFTSGLIHLTKENGVVVLPAIQLQPGDRQTLQTVVVSRKKPSVEQRIDRTIVNVDALIAAAGASVLEVLQQSPGVIVNNDGSISVRGKQGSLVYIDNKPTYLAGSDLANYLRSLPSDAVSKIEIMPNPPASYDATGNAGIINIVTKKIIEKGFNGSATVNYGQGIYWKASTNANVNYRHDKINLYGTASFSANNDFVDEDNDRQFFKTDGSLNALFLQKTFLKKEKRTTNLKIGMDYYLNKNTTWGVVLTGMFRPEKSNWTNRNDLLNGNGVADSTIRSFNSSDDRWKQGGINLNLRSLLDSAGRKITVDLDYLTYRDRIGLLFQNYTYGPGGSLKSRDDLIGTLPIDIDIWSAKLDYTHPAGDGFTINSGVKTSYVKNKNKAEYFNRIDGTTTIDNDKTNSFLYDEQIYAAYVEINKGYKKFDWQAGLRLENTNIKGHQLGNSVKPDSAFKRHYTNLFPTFFALWRIDSAGKHQLALNYGRRIQRPLYQDLNPFLFFIDKFTYTAGNPYLTPQFTHTVALSHIFKERYTTTLSWSYIKGLFVETNEKLDYVFVSRAGNIGRQTNLTASFSASIDIAGWWSANISADLVNSQIKSVFYNIPLDTTFNYLTGNITNQFQFGKGWSAELSGSGRTTYLVGQYTIKDIWNLNAAVRKTVLKGRGALRVAVRDIFYSSIVRGNINNLTQATAHFSNGIDSRMLVLSFNYRFGKAFNARQRYESNAADDEKGRVKNSN